jgi:hypothetical protein
MELVDPNHVPKITTLNNLARAILKQGQQFDLQQEYQHDVSHINMPAGVYTIISLDLKKVKTCSRNTGNIVEHVRSKNYVFQYQQSGETFIVMFEKPLIGKKLSKDFTLSSIERGRPTILQLLISSNRQASLEQATKQ